MYIRRIRIRNFRSLVDAEIIPTNYNVLAGANDSGKSNVLRALNLFFNGQTDVGVPIVFSQDYSQQAVVRSNKAKEIEVEVEFQPPSNYTDNLPVIWKKSWREGSNAPYSDHLRIVGGMEFSSRSRTEYWVRQIAFEYVPAIRGKEFFSILKRRLHNTLAATIAPKLESASGNFLGNIRREISQIESEALRLFSLRTEFSLPSDLGNLFEILDLKTADGHAATPLQNRGDGIQGRHIPVILRFLAEQRKINFARGRPPSETIWGYEEPENNLELSKQIEEADEFLRCSSKIQVFLTTHSPAFYGVAKGSAEATNFFANRENGSTSFKNSFTSQALDRDLGLMPFIAPYMTEAVARRQEMLDQIAELHSQSLHLELPVLCLEGSSDKSVIKAACEVMFGEDLPFEIVAKSGLGGGVGWASGYATARAIMPDLTKKTAILFDEDQAGRDAQKKLNDRLRALERTDKAKTFMLGKSKADEVRKLFQAGVAIPIELEEICGEAAWDHAEEKGWLEPRLDAIKLNAENFTFDQSYSDFVKAKISDLKSQRLALMCVSDNRKGNFGRFVAAEIKSSGSVPSTLKNILDEIKKYLC